MSELVKMLVQATDLAEHQAKTFLQLLTEHIREEMGAPAAPGADVEAAIAKVRQDLDGELDKQHEDLGEQLAKLREDMGELRQTADAALKASTERPEGGEAESVDQTINAKLIEDAAARSDELDKRLHAVETKLKALSKKATAAAA